MDIKSKDELIDKIANYLERWGLTVPGIAFVEANRPFGFLGGQFLLFFQPLLNGFVHPAVSDQYIRLLEDRDALEQLIRKLEVGLGQAAQEDVTCK